MLKEVKGNIWKAYENGDWVAITTNCVVNKNHHAIMGAGIAKQAKDRFPQLPKLLGQKMINGGIEEQQPIV